MYNKKGDIATTSKKAVNELPCVCSMMLLKAVQLNIKWQFRVFRFTNLFVNGNRIRKYEAWRRPIPNTLPVKSKGWLSPYEK
mmetsp:Transcript_30167/g.53447  ORF Transcript_30167/g.53447 Transcript_30167/m.53447 type:complete len:82 (+) Transcript_30167:371-616(+)